MRCRQIPGGQDSKDTQLTIGSGLAGIPVPESYKREAIADAPAIFARFMVSRGLTERNRAAAGA